MIRSVTFSGFAAPPKFIVDARSAPDAHGHRGCESPFSGSTLNPCRNGGAIDEPIWTHRVLTARRQVRLPHSQCPHLRP